MEISRNLEIYQYEVRLRKIDFAREIDNLFFTVQGTIMTEKIEYDEIIEQTIDEIRKCFTEKVYIDGITILKMNQNEKSKN